VSLMKNIFAVEGQSLSKTFLRKGGSQIVLFSHLSVSFKKGEVVGLVGPSGKGKTTLGDILLGLIVPDRGKVLWKGQDIRTLSKTKKKNLRPYFQKIHQDPGSSFPQNRLIRTIFEDFFRWGYHPALSSEKEWWNALGEGMEKASLSERLLHRYPCQLSGGELQRFALLRALLFSPLFLVADEPTSRLDPSVQAKVAHMLVEEAHVKSIAVLFISHDEVLLNALCSRIIRLE
jgi:ABC-type oligopeptide transport system ATPase subunit